MLGQFIAAAAVAVLGTSGSICAQHAPAPAGPASIKRTILQKVVLAVYVVEKGKALAMPAP
jgi:hypothetical protein